MRHRDHNLDKPRCATTSHKQPFSCENLVVIPFPDFPPSTDEPRPPSDPIDCGLTVTNAIDLTGSSSPDSANGSEYTQATPTKDPETENAPLIARLAAHDAPLHQPRHDKNPMLGPHFFDTSPIGLYSVPFLCGLYADQARMFGVNGNFVVRFLSEAFEGTTRMTNLVYAMDQAIANRSFLTSRKEATAAVAQLVLSTVNELLRDFRCRFHARRNDPKILYDYEAVMIQRAFLQWEDMLDLVIQPHCFSEASGAVVSLAATGSAIAPDTRVFPNVAFAVSVALDTHDFPDYPYVAGAPLNSWALRHAYETLTASDIPTPPPSRCPPSSRTKPGPACERPRDRL